MRYLQIDCGKCGCRGTAALEFDTAWRCDECFHFARGEPAILIPIPVEQTECNNCHMTCGLDEGYCENCMAKNKGH